MKQEQFSNEEGKIFLKIARETLIQYLKSKKVPKFTPTVPSLNTKSGLFVTLHTLDGNLRGCIGNMQGTEPLYKAIPELTIASATGDPRFSPMNSDEINKIKIELSVLSPLKKVKNADEIELGRHGVLVKKGFCSGVFLPQVAAETCWNKEQFLSNLCEGKAGLRSDAWKDKDAELFVFTVQIFKEE